MKGDVKVIVSGETGRLVLDESSLIKRILMYVISAILGFGALFLAIMMDSRASTVGFRVSLSSFRALSEQYFNVVLYMIMASLLLSNTDKDLFTVLRCFMVVG